MYDVTLLVVGLICSLFLSPTIFYYSAFHGLAVSGWGLRTDTVLILSQPCTPDSFLLNKNNDNNNTRLHMLRIPSILIHQYSVASEYSFIFFT